MAEINHDPDRLNFTRNLAFQLLREQFIQPRVNTNHCLKWLERVIKTIDSVRATPSQLGDSALFSMGSSRRKAIISTINNAKHSIDDCVFTTSDIHGRCPDVTTTARLRKNHPFHRKNCSIIQVSQDNGEGIHNFMLNSRQMNSSRDLSPLIQ